MRRRHNRNGLLIKLAPPCIPAMLRLERGIDRREKMGQMVIKNLARSSLAFLVMCLLSATVTASETKELAALQAARAWLAIVDAGDYEHSWNASASYFRTAVSKEQWRQSLNGIRHPLGNVLTRELKSKSYVTELPGAPDGEYVVIQFNTTFENKRVAVETVTPVLEDGGSWRVTGYFIK